MLKKIKKRSLIKTGLISALSIVLMGGTLSYASNIKEARTSEIRTNITDSIGVQSKRNIEVVKENRDIASSENLNLYVGEKGLNLMQEPFNSLEVLGSYKHGKEVQLLRKLPNNWARLKIDNLEGFARIDDLIHEYIPKDPQGKDYKANTIYLMGKEVPYKNTGPNHCQSQIDNHPETAATFGGTATFSGNDNMNTHFAAHNYGAFNNIWNMKIGSEIIVTDGNKEPFKYKLNNIKKVTYDGYGYADGKDYWNEITGTGGGERIVLQTCIYGDDNGVWILTANKSED